MSFRARFFQRAFRPARSNLRELPKRHREWLRAIDAHLLSDPTVASVAWEELPEWRPQSTLHLAGLTVAYGELIFTLRLGMADNGWLVSLLCPCGGTRRALDNANEACTECGRAYGKWHGGLLVAPLEEERPRAHGTLGELTQESLTGLRDFAHREFCRSFDPLTAVLLTTHFCEAVDLLHEAKKNVLAVALEYLGV